MVLILFFNWYFVILVQKFVFNFLQVRLLVNVQIIKIETYNCFIFCRQTVYAFNFVTTKIVHKMADMWNGFLHLLLTNVKGCFSSFQLKWLHFKWSRSFWFLHDSIVSFLATINVENCAGFVELSNYCCPDSLQCGPVLVLQRSAEPSVITTVAELNFFFLWTLRGPMTPLAWDLTLPLTLT